MTSNTDHPTTTPEPTLIAFPAIRPTPQPREHGRHHIAPGRTHVTQLAGWTPRTHGHGLVRRAIDAALDAAIGGGTR